MFAMAVTIGIAAAVVAGVKAHDGNVQMRSC